ncbi:hypothetical protein [Streptomyces hirsutus]|uniref:hypothetical protein n=1 Tax=Streptomyces hirsutus TaxID=35620 RepID=UPI003689E34D
MQHNVQPAMPLCGARRPGWERPGPGRHRLPCVVSTGHAGAHRDAFGKTWQNEQPVLLTEAQATLAYDNTVGVHRTAPIESAMRDIDDCHTTAENAAVPLFQAEIVVTDWKPQAPVQVDGRFQSGGTVDGQFTQLWFSYGATIGTVTPGKAREIATEMRAFAARLEALCDRADEIAAEDHEDDAGRFFARHFPKVAAFLANERARGEQQ